MRCGMNEVPRDPLAAARERVTRLERELAAGPGSSGRSAE